MPYVIGEVEVTNEVSLAPSAVMYDGAVVADGDLTVQVNNFYYDLGGTKGKYLGSVGNSVANNNTNYVFLDGTGSLGINTSGYPLGIHIRLARVVASGGFIVRVILERAFLTAATSGGSSSVTHIVQTFNWTDVIGGPVTMGIIPAGSVVSGVILSIGTTFDGGTQMEIGSDLAHAEIMAATDNMPDYSAKYSTTNDVRYLVPTAVRVFFPAGTPTQGTAQVTMFIL